MQHHLDAIFNFFFLHFVRIRKENLGQLFLSDGWILNYFIKLNIVWIICIYDTEKNLMIRQKLPCNIFMFLSSYLNCHVQVSHTGPANWTSNSLDMSHLGSANRISNSYDRSHTGSVSWTSESLDTSHTGSANWTYNSLDMNHTGSANWHLIH